VLRPTTLWRIVVLVMAVGMLGHLAQRLLGLRWGLPVAGFFSGFVSSTAALAHLGHKAREDAQLVHSASAAALLSNLASLLLMMGVIGAVSPSLLSTVTWPLAAAGFSLLSVALLSLRQGAPRAASSIKLTDSAFKLSHAVVLALVMGGVSLLSAGLQALLGDAGVLVTAVLVAIVEVHAAAASVAQMSMASGVSLPLSAWSLVAVLASSAVAKTFLAFFSGGAGFGWRVGLGLWVMVLSAALTLLLPA
jgi:uncharacterized membrane protein (DUF4010 family)